MPRKPDEGLTQRESQIMEVVWQIEEASVEDIRSRLADDIADSTVRTLLTVMEKKGYVQSRKGEKGKTKLYAPLVPKKDAQASALHQLIHRLFEGSADMLVARLVEERQVDLRELEKLQRQLDGQREERS